MAIRSGKGRGVGKKGINIGIYTNAPAAMPVCKRLFKGRAKPATEQYHTKEGKALTRQTGKLEWSFLKRTNDGRYQAIADEGQNGFTPEKAATFLTSVYTPVVTPSGS